MLLCNSSFVPEIVIYKYVETKSNILNNDFKKKEVNLLCFCFLSFPKASLSISSSNVV